MKFEINWEGVDYAYNPEEIDMETAIVIKAETTWGLATLSKEVDDIHPLALQALFFAIRRQNGERLAFKDCVLSYPVKFYNEVRRATIASMAADLEEPGKVEGDLPPTPTPTSTSSEI